MATIPIKRPFALGTFGYQGAAPVFDFRVAASQANVLEGDIAVLSSGLADVTGNNAIDNAGTAIGMVERSWTTALATSTFVPITLFLPGKLYELSITGTAAVTQIGNNYAGDTDADAEHFNLAIGTAATGEGGFYIISFASDQSKFETDNFIGPAGTSATSGNVNTPFGAPLGEVGDDNVRVIATPGTLGNAWVK